MTRLSDATCRSPKRSHSRYVGIEFEINRVRIESSEEQVTFEEPQDVSRDSIDDWESGPTGTCEGIESSSHEKDGIGRWEHKWWYLGL